VPILGSKSFDVPTTSVFLYKSRSTTLLVNHNTIDNKTWSFSVPLAIAWRAKGGTRAVDCRPWFKVCKAHCKYLVCSLSSIVF